MKKFLKYLKENLFKIDKLWHFLAGMFIYILVWHLIGIADYLSVLIVALVAVGKEYRDARTGKGTPEYLDIYVTVLPALVIYIINLTYNK